MKIPKRWIQRPDNEALIKILADGLKVSIPVAKVLINRGINSLKEAEVFIYPDKGALDSPFLLPDMENAVRRIRQAVDKKEKILVYGDRDVDGITSICVMIRTLRSIGSEPFWYIPGDEGYGVHKTVIERYAAQGVTLIVTVDCGITAFECAEYAKEIGIDMVITDHHEPAAGGLPNAVAVVDPKRADSKYPFIDLAGCAVAFKVSEALMQSFGRHFDRDIVSLGYTVNKHIGIYALKSTNGRFTGKIEFRLNNFNEPLTPSTLETVRQNPSGGVEGGPTSSAGKDDGQVRIRPVARPPSPQSSPARGEEEKTKLEDFINFIKGALVVTVRSDCFMQLLDPVLQQNGLPALPEGIIDIEERLRRQFQDNPGDNKFDAAAFETAGAEEKASMIFSAFEQIEEYGDLRMKFFRESNLDAVALGTIADIMPLVNENRILVKKGLKQLVNTQKVGLRGLIEKCGQKNKQGLLSAKSVSWNITPVLNAAGRRGKAGLSAEMLLTDNAKRASELLGDIMKLNSERKELQAENLEKFLPMLESQCDLENDKIFVVTATGIEHGVTGIIASQIMRQYRRPTVLLIIENGEAMGAARSFEGFDILSALSKIYDILIKFGGHSQAAGLTVPVDKLDEFRARLKAIADAEISPETLIPSIEIDAELDPQDASMGLIEELSQLEPYGMGNPHPIFALRNMKIKEVTRMGTDGGHLRLKVSKNGSVALGAVGWGLGHLEEELAVESFIDLAVVLEVNTWQDRSRVQLLIEDIKPSEN